MSDNKAYYQTSARAFWCACKVKRSMLNKKVTVTTRSFTSYINWTRLTSALLWLITQSLESIFRGSLKVSFMNTAFCFQGLTIVFLMYYNPSHAI